MANASDVLPTEVGPKIAIIEAATFRSIAARPHATIGSGNVGAVNLHGTTTLLTGATGGIGHAIARALHASGSDLILTGRRTEVLEPLAAELGARSIAVDLSDRAALHKLVAECEGVDILVANAALPASGPLDSFTEEQIDRALEVNLHAPIVLSHLLSPAMVKRGRGHLLYISSLAGKTGSPGTSIYSATKFGLRGFAQGLRADLHGTGVGVSAVFPGFVSDAGMFADAQVELPSYVKTSTPEEVAAGVIRAITDDRGEVDVAPLGMRLGATLSSIAPSSAAAFTRRVGGGKLSESVGDAQRDKR